MRALAAFVAIGLTAVAVLSGSREVPRHAAAASFQQPPTVLEGLAMYAGGAFDAALAPVRTTADIQAVYDTLSTRGATWIDQPGDAAAVSRRRLVAAAFALEVAAAKRIVSGSDRAKQREVRLKLIAWGAAALSTTVPVFPPAHPDPFRAEKLLPAVAPVQNVPAQAAERAWFQAAIGVIENLEAWEALIELPAPLRAVEAAAGRVQRTFPLVPFALERWPNEPFVLLARAEAEEHFGCWPDKCQLGTFRLSRASAVDPDDVFALPERYDVSGERRGLFKAATAHHKALLTSSMVAFESNLRFGFLQHVQGDGPLAREHLGAARRLSRDPFIQYVGAFLEGASWESDGRATEAEAAYRAALTVAPRARSASTRLAALLFVSGRGPEGISLLDGALLTDQAADDPWLRYGLGEGRSWSTRLARLRDELK